MSTNTKLAKQTIMGKQHSTSGTKLYSVTPFPKFKFIPKVVESNALSKPVTSNSAPSPRELIGVNNDKVIAPGMFRINPFKNFREEKFMSINKVRASVRSKPITVSPPHVFAKKDVDFDSNGLFDTRVNNTAQTRRPQSKSNTKNDRLSCVNRREQATRHQI
ncbi:hypothetical protein Tco_0726392 [Tanacetum coccineum]|uniref:TPX2 central domain-containing protein n=1 Tax=Tanacetum coccineum TaxID=301880 RepID=A0ABQ4YGI9_9ASTR